MSAQSQLGAEARQGLKAAQRRLVKLAGGQIAAAAASRIGQQHISRCIHLGGENADMHLPLDVVADLEDFCGLPVVSQFLVERLGFLIVARPDGSSGPPELMRAAGAAMGQVSDVFAGIGAALDDDTITQAEAEVLGGLLDQAEVQLEGLKLRLNSMVAK